MLSFFFLFLKVTFDSIISYFVPVLPLAYCIFSMPNFFSTWSITTVYNVLFFFFLLLYVTFDILPSIPVPVLPYNLIYLIIVYSLFPIPLIWPWVICLLLLILHVNIFRNRKRFPPCHLFYFLFQAREQSNWFKATKISKNASYILDFGSKIVTLIKKEKSSRIASFYIILWFAFTSYPQMFI